MNRRTHGGYPDLVEYPSGPTVISTGTLRRVVSWGPEMTLDEDRFGFRANVEVGCAPPFWEGRPYTATDAEVESEIGNVTFGGMQPTPGCAVPPRNPRTGEGTDGFRETFVERRARTYPDWGEEAALERFFDLVVNTSVPDSEVDETIAVGDTTTVIEDPTAEREAL